MNATITAFTDYGNNSFSEQVALNDQLGLKQFCLRKVLGKTFLDYDDSLKKGIISYFAEKKILVAAFDPMIKPYDLSSEKQAKDFRTSWEKAVLFAKQIGAESIYYELPNFDDPVTCKQAAVENIKLDFAFLAKSKLHLVIKFNYSHKANAYYYILQSLPKGITILFDPAFFLKNNESVVTNFRLFRESIHHILVDDYDKFKQHRLIGFGAVNWQDLVVKLKRINFIGIFIFDLGVIDSVTFINKKTARLKKLAKSYRRKTKIQYDLKARVGSEETFDILKHQIQVLGELINH